jgi:uncharacterized protein (TIGR02996 family)
MDAEELAFLSAVVANLDDDTLRLVYADWLDERGHTDRATYIRLHVRATAAGSEFKVPLTMLEEAARLRVAAPAAWAAPVPPRLAQYFRVREHYERGLLAEVSGDVAGLLAHLPELCRLAPLREVVVLDSTDALAQHLPELCRLAPVRHVVVRDSTDALAQLLRLPELSRLRTLCVWAPRDRAEAERFLRMLTESRPVPKLEYHMVCSRVIGPPQFVGDDNVDEWLSPDDRSSIRAWNPSAVPSMG